MKLQNTLFSVLFITLVMIALGCTNSKEPQKPLPSEPALAPIETISTTKSPILPAPAAPALPAPTATIRADIPGKSSATNKRLFSKHIERAKEQPKTIAEFPVSIPDRYGKEIIFDKAPERIIAFDSAAIETLFAIGEGHRVIGTHDYVIYPPEASDVMRVGDAFNMDIEAVLNLEPDLVYLFYPTYKDQLEDAGLKVLLIETIEDDFKKMADHFRMWGAITGAVNNAEAIAEDFEARVEIIETALAPFESGPSVFQDVGSFWTPGNDTLVGNVFEVLKLVNIASEVKGYAQISPEVIVERDPQYIISSYGDIYSIDPAFAEVLAIKNRAVFVPNEDYLSVSGPRFILGVEEIAHLIYPGIFK